MDRSDSTSSTGSTISTHSMPDIKIEGSDAEDKSKPQEGNFKHRRTHSATPALENIKEESLSQTSSTPGTPLTAKKLPDRMTRSAEELNKSSSSDDEEVDGEVKKKPTLKKTRPSSAGNRLNPNFERGASSRTTSKHLGRFSKSSSSLHTEALLAVPRLTTQERLQLHEVAFQGINTLEGKLIHAGDYTPQDVQAKFLPAFKVPEVKEMEKKFKEFEPLREAWRDFKQDARAFIERGTVLPHEKDLRDKSKQYLKERERHSKDSHLQTRLRDFVLDNKKFLTAPGIHSLSKPLVTKVNQSLANTLEAGRDRMSEASDRRDEHFSDFSEQALQNKRFEFSCNKLSDTLAAFGMNDLVFFEGQTASQSACNSLSSLQVTIKVWASQLANYRDGITSKEKK
ncbi:hypothetical protein [Endozoicomonas arenosclerae]|uniref:hypothetical protein n=1 Tax=Endozoicomonas arenosclerae TaxID=1633495 RepID=UPI0007846B54|nr:hypothetical protein [Endozoicomonas arenosclerae]